jgi:Uma2 family endonuclease
MATTAKLLTVEILEQMGPAGESLELIYGIPRERGEVSVRHGIISGDILTDLNIYVRTHNLGSVFGSDTQFLLATGPDVVVRPDASFVRADRLPDERDWDRIMRQGPDLAVEVVSSNDRVVEVMAKIELYRAAGVPLIWLVEPRSRTVTVFADNAEPRTFGEGDTLDGGDVLPDFRLPVAQIFR